MSADPQYEFKVFTSQELQEHPCLLPLWSMINSAFISHRKGFLQPSHRDSDRFQTPQDVVSDLGPHGLCCVLFIADDTHTPIAYAGVKPYKEHFRLEVGGDVDDSGSRPTHWYSIIDWELSSVVVQDDARYARKGFAARCCTEVESALVNRFRDERSKKQDDRGMPKKITIWIQAIRELAGAYWSRRGYQEVSVKRVGAGGWGAARPFDLINGKKELAM
ncbi:hypothetical protein SI65_00477 [Aspergillus cristatus]|uniref:N-acetyltransferase domain-containing protein n=1 Tax=Aspergillus cristatus TaxID=573508 RepID=A0A1E3BPN9_ASPCR|nr:hypothetical protein SI65_00477 [Aspergillus cristatus]